MSESNTEEMEAPIEMFSSVWVKMEVEEEEEGEVEGLDQPDDEQDYLLPDHSQGSEEPPASPVQTRRSRRKPAAPRKAKNVEEKYFHCELCDYKAIHKSSLKYHQRKHTKPISQKCDFCSYTTTHVSAMRRHMQALHTDFNDPIVQAMPDLKCKECDFTCKFSWKLIIHRQNHSKKMLQCDQCQYQTFRRSNYDKHRKIHKTEDVTYECDKCLFVTKHEGHIARHLAVIHKEVLEGAQKCDFCDFSTKVRWRLTIHVKNSRQEKPIKCEFCEFVTEYNCAYKLHKQHHMEDMVHVSDVDVNKYFSKIGRPMKVGDSSEGIYEKEFIIDTSCEEIDWRSIEVEEKPGLEKPYHCIRCPYVSKFKASVQRHFQRNHTSENSKPYKCVHCDFSTKTRDQITLHSKRSRSNYPVTCKICAFATFYKCQMAEHHKVHWQYKCKLCDYVCRINYDLNQHYQIVHLGNGLKCRFCDFQAARKSSLLGHENTHTNKRFRCGLCEYSASRRNLLFNHIKRNHSGEKPKIIISDEKFASLKKVDGQNENIQSEIDSDAVEKEKSVQGETSTEKSIESENNFENDGNTETIEHDSQLKHDKTIEDCQVVHNESNEDDNQLKHAESNAHDSQLDHDKTIEYEINQYDHKLKRIKRDAHATELNHANTNANARQLDPDKSTAHSEVKQVKDDNQLKHSVSNMFDNQLQYDERNVNDQLIYSDGKAYVSQLRTPESDVYANQLRHEKDIASINKFETQVYIERQNEFERKNVEFQNNLYENSNVSQEMYGETRDNAFYTI